MSFDWLVVFRFIAAKLLQRRPVSLRQHGFVVGVSYLSIADSHQSYSLKINVETRNESSSFSRPECTIVQSSSKPLRLAVVNTHV